MWSHFWGFSILVTNAITKQGNKNSCVISTFRAPQQYSCLKSGAVFLYEFLENTPAC